MSLRVLVRTIAVAAVACATLSAGAQPGPAAKMRAESQALIDAFDTQARQERWGKLVFAGRNYDAAKSRMSVLPPGSM